MHSILTRNLFLYVAARSLVTVAVQIQSVALSWFIYTQTGSAYALGFIGLAQFLPAIPTLTFAGYAADHFDRRKVLMTAQAIQAAALGLMALTVHFTPETTVLIYGLVLLIGAARQAGNPSLIAMLPSAVPRDQYPRAIAISSSAQKFAQVIGPMVGGFGYALIGQDIFWFNPVLPLAALIAVLLMRMPKHDIEPRGDSSPMQRTLAGFSYIRSNRLLLGLLSLDLFAVLFGGVTALLPIFAHDVLHVGSTGLGLLAAATPIGAVITGLSLAFFQLDRRAGPTMLIAIVGYGIAIVTFGLSTNFFLSLFALVCSGACDITSTVIRQTIIQTTTPDAMRGRVSAVNMVFSGTSNQLGNFESGVVAGLIGAVPAAIVGGVGTLIVVAASLYVFPEIRRVNQIRSSRTSPAKV